VLLKHPSLAPCPIRSSSIPIIWSGAADFPESATDAIDFVPRGHEWYRSPGSQQPGWPGERGKGDAELHDSMSTPNMKIGGAKGGALVSFAPGKEHLYTSMPMLAVPLGGGTTRIGTPFSRLLGEPPIMVAGMPRSAVKASFVLDAGYDIELAGGGRWNAAAPHSTAAEIQRKIHAGAGITLSIPDSSTCNILCGKECTRKGFSFMCRPVFLLRYSCCGAGR
jgi:hypothetical protein